MFSTIKAKYSETKESINLQYLKPSLRYLDEFIKLKCASDLLQLKLFPNAKEITESMSVYNAYRKNFISEYPPNKENIRCIVIGDGCTPRTGALFAMRTNWLIYSVDPRLRTDSISEHHLKVDRLILVKDKIENVPWALEQSNLVGKKILLIAVHSHAPLQKAIDNIRTGYNGTLDLISIPCCVPDNLYIKPDKSYIDMGISSEKREIHIYKDI